LITNHSRHQCRRFQKSECERGIAALHKLADDYYAWRNEIIPSGAARPGFTRGTIADRLFARQIANAPSTFVRSGQGACDEDDNWPKDERIDWILFSAQLENVEFGIAS